MKTLLHKTIILTLATIFGLSILATTTVTAADDPSIKGVLREDIKASMMSFIDSNTIKEKYFIYDAVGGRLLDLKFAKLHEGIEWTHKRKISFYISIIRQNTT